jgi:hypothetical protein
MKNNNTKLSAGQFGGTEVTTKGLQLNPYFITGFSDAESSFVINIRETLRSKTRWEVLISFQIGLHLKDQDLLEKIRVSLGVGRIYKGNKWIQLRVQSLKDLTNVIIPLFEKYPLISKKRGDFELFKQILDIMNRKEHLTMEGIRKIIAIKSSMNIGLNDKLKEAFPDTIPVQRPVKKLPKSLDYYRFAGFGRRRMFFNSNFKIFNFKFRSRSCIKIYYHST